MPEWNEQDGAARRMRRVRIVRDEHGRIVRQVVFATDFLVDEYGGINQVETEDQTRFHSCGCNADQPPGGKCIGCDRVSCASCFTRCLDCKRPLCLACAHYLTDDGKELTFCPECIGPVRRWRYADSILSVLEEFDGE